MCSLWKNRTHNNLLSSREENGSTVLLLAAPILIALYIHGRPLSHSYAPQPLPNNYFLSRYTIVRHIDKTEAHLGTHLLTGEKITRSTWWVGVGNPRRKQESPRQ